MKWVMCLVSLLMLTGCTANEAEWKTIPLPSFKEPITLRVIYAENPRFSPLSNEDINMLLLNAQAASETYLGAHVRFELLPAITIKTLFGYLKPEVRRARQKEIYDFRHGSGERKRLVSAMIKGLKERHTPLEEMIDYAAPYLTNPSKTQTLPAFAAALADTLIERIALWQKMEASDSQPAIDDSPYNEWTYWDSLGYSPLPFDIVITNTLIASVEYYGQDIHSALRGGLTVGTTTNAKTAPLGGFIFWSTYPFTENNPLLKELRGGEQYTPDVAMMLSGTYLAHEIGHLLFHYGHPFEGEACIMNPVPMLHFGAWAKKLDRQKCEAGEYPAMKKGAAKIYYNTRW